MGPDSWYRYCGHRQGIFYATHDTKTLPNMLYTRVPYGTVYRKAADQRGKRHTLSDHASASSFGGGVSPVAFSRRGGGSALIVRSRGCRFVTQEQHATPTNAHRGDREHEGEGEVGPPRAARPEGL